jgi:hypothetical protein
MKTKKNFTQFQQLYIKFQTYGRGHNYLSGYNCTVPASCTLSEAKEYAARILPVVFGSNNLYHVMNVDLCK